MRNSQGSLQASAALYGRIRSLQRTLYRIRRQTPEVLKSRDFYTVLKAGLFLAPIVYPLGIVPERFHFYLYLWPPTPVMQYARSVLVGGTVPSLQAHLLLLAVTLGVLCIGLPAFRRLSPRAAEYL